MFDHAARSRRDEEPHQQGPRPHVGRPVGGTLAGAAVVRLPRRRDVTDCAAPVPKSKLYE